MKTALLAVAFVAVAPPAFAFETMCDRGYDKREVFILNLGDKNIRVELHGRNETYNQIKAEKTFPIYSVTGKVNKIGKE